MLADHNPNTMMQKSHFSSVSGFFQLFLPDRDTRCLFSLNFVDSLNISDKYYLSLQSKKIKSKKIPEKGKF